MLNNGMRSFDSWHFSMLNDNVRTFALESAIKELDLNGKKVFEIGTGAGLTSMMFAKYGAKKILTCEINKQLYEQASVRLKNYCCINFLSTGYLFYFSGMDEKTNVEAITKWLNFNLFKDIVPQKDFIKHSHHLIVVVLSE